MRHPPETLHVGGPSKGIFKPPLSTRSIGSGPGTFIRSCPLFQGIAREAPKLQSVGGDFEPIVTNEEEIVGAFWQSAKVWATSIRKFEVPKEVRFFEVDHAVTHPTIDCSPVPVHSSLDFATV